MEGKFSFEGLDVWNKSVDFSIQIIQLTGEIKLRQKNYRLLEQLEACSASIPANIAEGKGGTLKKNLYNFFI